MTVSHFALHIASWHFCLGHMISFSRMLTVIPSPFAMQFASWWHLFMDIWSLSSYGLSINLSLCSLIAFEFEVFGLNFKGYSFWDNWETIEVLHTSHLWLWGIQSQPPYDISINYLFALDVVSLRHLIGAIWYLSPYDHHSIISLVFALCKKHLLQAFAYCYSCKKL